MRLVFVRVLFLVSLFWLVFLFLKNWKRFLKLVSRKLFLVGWQFCVRFLLEIDDEHHVDWSHDQYRINYRNKYSCINRVFYNSFFLSIEWVVFLSLYFLQCHLLVFKNFIKKVFWIERFIFQKIWLVSQFWSWYNN